MYIVDVNNWIIKNDLTTGKVGPALYGWYSVEKYTHNVVAVVALAQDVTVSGNSTDGWTY